jgi:hypothetical protein
MPHGGNPSSPPDILPSARHVLVWRCLTHNC